MARENFQTQSGVLERWSKVFEKSQGSHIPRTNSLTEFVLFLSNQRLDDEVKLPYRETVTRTDLELEDVFEEVKEEVNSKVSKQLTNTKSLQENTPGVSVSLNLRKSRELVRPKTPGRLGLYQESSLPSKKPPWQSSTKIGRQQNTQYELSNPQTAESTFSSRIESSEVPYQFTNRCPSKARDMNSSKLSNEKTPVKPADVAAIKPTKPFRSATASRSSTPPRSVTPVRATTPVRASTPVRPVISVISIKHVTSGGEPISQRTAKELRQVLFGSALVSFNSDWTRQHINFLTHSSYGLSFYKPGPCGLMACIQAFLMKHLLFLNKTTDINEGVLDSLQSERQQALVSAIASIIWQAGYNSNGIVTLPCGTCKWQITKEYRGDELTENLVIFRFNDLIELEKFIKRNLFFFENTSGNGCIIFLYSVILSHTIKGIYLDMGNFNSKLMADNEACSQSMINLLLTGHAVNHVFNGDIEYDKRGNALPAPLKGIKVRSDIGFLTLEEHLKPKEIQVGSMLKTPKYPIWVVDSTGGRYDIVFCLKSELVNDWRLERRFMLSYYNGTTKYSSSLDDIITVDTRDIVDESEITEDTHPVEHILRTKWPGAVIEWN